MKRSLEKTSAVLLVVMFLTTLYQVVARVVLGVSSVWSEELARFLYVCLVFIGTVPLVKDDEHVRVGVLTDRLGTRATAVMKVLTILLTLPFIAVMTWEAWMNIRLNWRTYAPTLDWLSIGYIYLAIWMPGVLMLWYLAVNLLRNLRALSGESAAAGGGGR